jgi:hypothetical protein
MRNVTESELEMNGDLVDEYPVDESQTNSNAGDATVFFYKGYYYELIHWNNNAEYHNVNKPTINFLGRTYGDEE